MTSSVTSTAVTARGAVAQRLIGGTVRRNYDPLVDIDWDADLDPDKWFVPAEAVSLYDTPMWDDMSDDQRRELSRQELANMLSRAVWFENTLNQGLLQTMLFQDPTATHVHYALTELGDETRHMVMFGRAVTAIGAQPYRLNRLQALGVQAFPFAYRGLFLWVAALCGEEWLDQAQRKYIHDENIQPLVRRIMQIHVTEEARHIHFARDGVRRRIKRAPWWEREFARHANGGAALVLDAMTLNPEAYRRCGLDAGKAERQARSSPHNLRRRNEFFAPMWEFFTEQGLASPVSARVWRQYGFLK